MAIDWTLISIPLAGGLDTKDDPRALLAPKSLDLENMVFTRAGQLSKRNGYRRLGNGEFSTVKALFTRGDELVVNDGTKLWTYLEGSDRFIEKGDLTPVTLNQHTVAKVTGEQTLADRAQNDGITVYAWEDSRGSVRYSIYDTDTDACIYSDQELAGASIPSVIAVGPFIHLIYYAAIQKELRALVIKPQNLAASLADTPVTLADDVRYSVPPVCAYDVAKYSDTRYLVAYVNEGGANLFKIGIIKQNGTIDIGYTATAKTNPADPDTIGLSCCALATGNILVGITTSADTKAFELGTSLTLVHAVDFGVPGVRIAVAPTDTTPVVDDGGITSTLTGNRVGYVFWEIDPGTGSADHYVGAIQWIASLGTASPTCALGHSSIASRGWQVGAEAYVNVVQLSALQTTYYTMRGRGRDDSSVSGQTSPSIHSRFLPGVAGGLPTQLIANVSSVHLGQVEDIGDGAYAWAGIYKTRLDSIPTTSAGSGPPDAVNAVYTERGIKSVVFDFEARLQAVQVGNSAYITGGMLWQYDGISPVEGNFLEFVEGVVLSDAGAGNVPKAGLGYHTYRVYPEWSNTNGERERGTCSASFTIQHNASRKIQVKIPTIGHTLRQGMRTDLSFAVYRTIEDPTDNSTFHRISSLDPSTVGADNGWIYNEPDPLVANFVTFVDNMTDAAIISKELDYRNGGELENIAPEPATSITGGQDRIYLAGFEDRNKFTFSKLHFDGDIVTFNDTLQGHIDEEGGSVVALVMLNETLIAFKEDKIYRIEGDGPDNTGQNGGYSPANIISTDVGCVDPTSIAIIPLGVLFKSSKGIYILGQGLDVQYIGAPVEAFNSQTITSATVVPGKNHVRFLTNSGRTLLYDYFFNQWSTFTNHEGTAAVLWKNQYVYARNDGTVALEVDELSTDLGAWITMAVETAWIKPMGLQGFARIRDAGFLGEYLSPHYMRLSYQYNYEPGWKYVYQWDPATVIDQSVYGEGGTYGTESPYGGAGSGNYQFLHGLREQKCEAVRFRIEDIEVTGQTPGGSFILTDLTLRVGGKGGIFKQNKDRKIGSAARSAATSTGSQSQ